MTVRRRANGGGTATLPPLSLPPLDTVARPPPTQKWTATLGQNRKQRRRRRRRRRRKRSEGGREGGEHGKGRRLPAVPLTSYRHPGPAGGRIDLEDVCRDLQHLNLLAGHRVLQGCGR